MKLFQIQFHDSQNKEKLPKFLLAYALPYQAGQIIEIQIPDLNVRLRPNRPEEFAFLTCQIVSISHFIQDSIRENTHYGMNIIVDILKTSDNFVSGTYVPQPPVTW